MAIDHLIAALEARAREQVDEMLREARRGAAEIVTRGEADLAAKRDRELAARERTLREQAAMTISEERGGTMRRALEARLAMLERVFERSAALLPEQVGDPAYHQAVPVHMEEALRYVNPDRARVRCTPALQRSVSAAAQPAGVEVIADGSIGTGVVVTEGDGGVTVENTLESRLARGRQRLAILMLRAFGEQGAEAEGAGHARVG